MKNLIYYIAPILSIFAILYMSSPVKLPVKTTLSGVIFNPIGDTVKVFNRDYSFVSRINHKGEFNMKTYIDSSDYFKFHHGFEVTSMYINPGDNIELALDTEMFDETVNYSNSKESEFLSKKLLIREEYFSNIDSIYHLSDSVFSDFLILFQGNLHKELNTVSNSVFIDSEKIHIASMVDNYHDSRIAYHERKIALESLPKQGEPEIDFTYPDQNGVDVSLSDFIGKYVYVDVWATWCGPCIYQMPFLVELEKEYHDKNIVFISVSVDEETNKEKWKDMLESKNMKGVQLFASGWNSKIMTDYVISRIPRFMLFDTDGNVIDLTAQRPSSEEIKLLFNEIL